MGLAGRLRVRRVRSSEWVADASRSDPRGGGRYELYKDIACLVLPKDELAKVMTCDASWSLGGGEGSAFAGGLPLRRQNASRHTGSMHMPCTSMRHPAGG